MKKKTSSLFLFLLILLTNSLSASTEAPRFVFVIPSYNNEPWALKNITSCTSQRYSNWHLYYVDDCSTDRTASIVSDYIRINSLENKCTLIRNPKRRGSLANVYNVITQCQPTDIIVLVDGDDYLAHQKVLNVLAGYYLDPRTWMTYGTFVSNPPGWWNNCHPIPEHISKNNAFRSHEWVCGHLRTFYAGLFQRIKKKDLMWQGNFFPMTGDMACIFPMLEMSSKGHIRRITDILYIYNVSNPINDHKTNADLQRYLDGYIRSLPRYEPLERLF